MKRPLNGRAVTVLSGGLDYYRMFQNYGAYVEGYDSRTQPPEDGDLEAVDLLVFTGGADVTPALYGEAKHSKTHCDPERDRIEELWYMKAIQEGVPMVGICRGGQFLNVMNGGKMRQHVVGHATGQSHLLHTSVGSEPVLVSSTHHQMMLPKKDVSELLGWGELCLLDGEPDAEVVYYPQTQSLCFQPHPEFFARGHECPELFMTFVETKLLQD